MSSNLISRKEARKRIHARGFSLAASSDLVEKLPKYPDGKRKKIREADLEKELERLLEPAPALPAARGKRILSQRNIESIYGRRQ